VLLSGAIVPGPGPLRLHRPQLTVRGQASPELMPEPRAQHVSALVAREAEAFWVEVHGLVRSTQNRGPFLVMQLEEEGRAFRAQISNLDQSRYPPLAGCRVRLHGVSAVDDGRNPDFVHVMVPDVGYMRIEEDSEIDAPTPGLRVLTTASQVRELSAGEAAKGYPVRLEAVVTYNDPEMRLLFVQDKTAGIYVEAWRHIHYVRAGDRVLVTGRSSPGLFAPIVDRPRLRVLGRGGLPEAPRVPPEQLMRGRYDSQWVEVEGVVHTATLRRPGAVVGMDAGGVPISVEIPGHAGLDLAAQLVNARVRVRGVCRSITTLKGQLAGTALNSPGLGALTVLTPPPREPFALPLQSIKTLLHFARGQAWDHRVRVRGIVTYSAAGEMYIRDDTGGLLVQLAGAPGHAVGDEVDVIGFAVPGEYSPALQDAETRLTGGAGAVASPAAITAEQAQSGRYDGELVQLEARLLDAVRVSGRQQLSLQAGPYLFTATLPVDESSSARVGSRLRLTGICAVSTNEHRLPQGFRLLLRSAGDVGIVRAAPFWTPQKAAWAAAALASVAGLALAWGVAMRRRVAAQSAIIWHRVKRETELQERQRIARELHDSLEQNLTGVSLSLGAASLIASNTMQEHLRHAIEQVRTTIAEVHRAVWELREDLVDARGLAAALGDIGQQLASCSATPIEVRTSVHGGPHPFSVPVENDLLRIGQEALTNAVKHGKASLIEVELRYEGHIFTLRVRDNGRGFDAGLAAPPGHFGLIGMRERARHIQADLHVRSAVGGGTEVLVTVPMPQPLALRQTG
jgi:signal transduction histidine kinase